MPSLTVTSVTESNGVYRIGFSDASELEGDLTALGQLVREIDQLQLIRVTAISKALQNGFPGIVGMTVTLDTTSQEVVTVG